MQPWQPRKPKQTPHTDTMISVSVVGSSSKGNCYLLDNGTSRLMLEAGISLDKVRQQAGFSLCDVAGCLVSHEHGDHSKYVKQLAKAGVDVFLSQETAEVVGATGHRIHHIHPHRKFNIEEWSIYPFDVEHDCPCLGFIISSCKDRVMFITDTAFCRYLFKGVTVLMIECNFSDDILESNIASGLIDRGRRKRLIETHFSLDRVKDFLMANDTSKLREIWLCHLSDENSDAARFKTEIQQLTGLPVIVA